MNRHGPSGERRCRLPSSIRTRTSTEALASTPTRRRALRAGALAALMAAGAAGCGTPKPSAQIGAHRLPEALSEIVVSPSGQGWAVAPAQAHWQVLHTTHAANGWKLDTPPGVSTRGGLIAGFPAAGAWVGVVAHGTLGFSPLALDSGGGGWRPSLAPGALADVPGSLAAASSNLAYAVIEAKGGQEVVATSDAGRNWSTIASPSALEGLAAARGCGAPSLAGLAANSAGVLWAAANCGSQRGGVTLLKWQPANRQWSATRLPLAGPPPGTPPVTEALGPVVASGGVDIPVVTGASNGNATLRVESTASGKPWHSTPVLVLGQVAAAPVIGVLDATIWALARSRSGAPTLQASTAGGAWRAVASPPKATIAVTPGPAGSGYALVRPGQGLLQVWTLPARGTAWRQVSTVPVVPGA